MSDDALEKCVEELALGMTTYADGAPKKCKWCGGIPVTGDGLIEHEWRCPTAVARRALKKRTVER